MTAFDDMPDLKLSIFTIESRINPLFQINEFKFEISNKRSSENLFSDDFF